MYPRTKYQNHYEGRMTPFRVIGNIYFVGCYQASSHLIDTGEGLILLDTGYADTLPLLIESIWELGFDPRNIRYIVHSHFHGDHAEGTRVLAAISGAKTVIGAADKAPLLERGYFDPDITVEDGDTLTLGSTTLRFVHTPGHTPGTMSIFLDASQDGVTYRVGMFGGAGSNTLVPSHRDFYPTCRQDYHGSIQRLLREKVDVFIGNHCWNNDTRGRGDSVLAGDATAFVDPEEWGKFLRYCDDRCAALPPLE